MVMAPAARSFGDVSHQIIGCPHLDRFMRDSVADHRVLDRQGRQDSQLGRTRSTAEGQGRVRLQRYDKAIPSTRSSKARSGRATSERARQDFAQYKNGDKASRRRRTRPLRGLPRPTSGRRDGHALYMKGVVEFVQRRPGHVLFPDPAGLVRTRPNLARNRSVVRDLVTRYPEVALRRTGDAHERQQTRWRSARSAWPADAYSRGAYLTYQSCRRSRSPTTAEVLHG